MTEQQFHNQRRIFVIFDGEVIFGPEGLSHYDWLVGRKILREIDYNISVRGYVDETGIYFYMRDFETNAKVEYLAKKFCDQIDKNLPVYCGCIKGEVGERWKPIKQLR